VKKFLLVLGVFCAFLVGYGATSMAFPAGGVNGRGEYNGYFTNVNDDKGTYVLPMDYEGGTRAIPDSINTPGEFINFIKYTKLDLDANGSGNAQEKTSAAFIIHTMLGTPIGQRNRPPTAAQIAEWERRVNYASSKGWISWSTSYSYSINSYYQGPKGGGSPNDDAMYDDSGSSNVAILFKNAAGKVVYALRRQCANPVGTGNLGPIPDDVSFNMDARTTLNITNPKPTQQIQFRNYVKNLGPGASTGVSWAAHNPLTGGNIATGGPATYADGQERLVYTENYTVPAGTAPGTKICRSTWATPNTAAGGTDIGDSVCATVRYDYDLEPNVTLEINDGTTTGGFAEVGDKVEFIYSVKNSGSTVSQSTACNIYGQDTTGYRALPGTADTSSTPGYNAPATGCPRTFPASATPTTIVTETIASVPAGSANKTLCRSLVISPVTPSGGSDSRIACVAIANKPYMRVYGGDVSVGNGQAGSSGTCTTVGQAAVVGWNRGSANAYAGAGAQYATYAMHQIFDFATAQGNTAGAPAPSGLAFANTAPSGSNFGGNIGSVPCITDYYGNSTTGTVPTNIGSPVNLAPIADGVYKASTTPGQAVQIGGTFPSGKRVVVYVDGDVLITSDIKFPGNWTSGNGPYFQLIVRGNIYVSKDVKQLDGVYVAQRNGSTGGVIYTCANPSLPALAITPAGGSLFGSCNNQLIINGSFVAFQVQFLRTYDTLRQSTATERGVSSSHAAEIFNYSPALWMTLPPGTTTTNDYDSITSLPPIL